MRSRSTSSRMRVVMCLVGLLAISGSEVTAQKVEFGPYGVTAPRT